MNTPYNAMALFMNVHNIPLTVAAACTNGSNTQWVVTFRDARFENINVKITALGEVTACSLTNKYQSLEESAASIFKK
jgi:hypothetical protein